MAQRKILFIDRPHPFLEERLQQQGFICDFQYHTPRAELLPLLADYFGVVMRSRLRVDREFIDRASNLAFIAREGVGVEHIDLAYAEEQGILVLTSPEGSRDTVAEHALGLLLALMNNLSRADREVRAGQWRREPNRGVEIKGKTVGIIGYGNMGRAFARRLSGFDCRVIAYDKYREDYGDAFAEAVALPALQAAADIVSLHIPYLPENEYLVNDAYLAVFQKPIWLVNTARGDVLDTSALVRALKSGKVQGAALDVLEYEAGSFNELDLAAGPAPLQFLRESDQVVLSPHIAGWSVESKIGHARVLAEKIAKRFG